MTLTRVHIDVSPPNPSQAAVALRDSAPTFEQLDLLAVQS